MTNAIADQNYVRSKQAVLNTDTVQGQNLVNIKAVESTGAMKVNTTDTISFTMIPIDSHDENYKTCLMWVGTDGLTYPWVATAAGEVLISTT